MCSFFVKRFVKTLKLFSKRYDRGERYLELSRNSPQSYKKFGSITSTLTLVFFLKLRFKYVGVKKKERIVAEL